MRRCTALLMILVCLLFAGCQKKDKSMQEALDFRTKLLASEGCKFTAQVQADYGERVFSFTLACGFDGEDGEITVLAPQTVAGIRAEIDGEDATLEFDGARLEYGKLANGHAAPLTVPWLLGSTWQEDYIALAGKDSGQTRVTYKKGYNEEELTVDTWFSEGVPTYGEVSYGGRRVLSITIQDFALNQ